MGRILVACEESQAVTIELRALGHEAYSCDVLPCSGGFPAWHIEQDVTGVLDQQWDLILAFPPCTYLTVTGNRWFNIEKYGDKARKRHKDRKEAIRFFMLFANANCERIAIENPVGVMSTEYRKPDQIINPWQFGDPFEKRTCIWLKGLPLLQPTDIVTPVPRKKYASGATLPAWFADVGWLDPAERARIRSKTFPGIAKAMAEQWGALLD